MRKLTLLLLLLLLPSCCATPQPTYPKPTPCPIPATTPPPVINPTACGASICLSLADAKAEARWVRRMAELRAAVARCSYVKEVP